MQCQNFRSWNCRPSTLAPMRDKTSDAKAARPSVCVADGAPDNESGTEHEKSDPTRFARQPLSFDDEDEDDDQATVAVVMIARTKRPSQRDEPNTSSLVDRRRECDGGHVRRGMQSHRFGVVAANGGVVVHTLVRTWVRSWRQRPGEHARAERRHATRNTKM